MAKARVAALLPLTQPHGAGVSLLPLFHPWFALAWFSRTFSGWVRADTTLSSWCC